MTKHREYHIRVVGDDDDVAVRALRQCLSDAVYVREVAGADGAVESLAKARRVTEAVRLLFPHVKVRIVSVSKRVGVVVDG